MMTCGVFRSLLLFLVALSNTGLVLPVLCQESTIGQFAKRRCENQMSPIANPFPNSGMAIQKASVCNATMQALQPIPNIDPDKTFWNKLSMAWVKSRGQLNRYKKYLSRQRQEDLDRYFAKLDPLFRNKEAFRRLRSEHIQAIVVYYRSFQSEILNLTKPVPSEEQGLVSAGSERKLLSEKDEQKLIIASTQFVALVQPANTIH